MSASWLPREQGMRIVCEGTGDKGCPKNEKRFTANVVAKHNRAHWKKEGWGRGLRKGYKRRDLCPSCMPLERELHKQELKDAAAWKAQRDENRKAKLEAKKAEPKKPRKKKASTAVSTGAVTEAEEANIGRPRSSPSADCAPAPA